MLYTMRKNTDHTPHLNFTEVKIDNTVEQKGSAGRSGKPRRDELRTIRQRRLALSTQEDP